MGFGECLACAIVPRAFESSYRRDIALKTGTTEFHLVRNQGSSYDHADAQRLELDDWGGVPQDSVVLAWWYG